MTDVLENNKCTAQFAEWTEWKNSYIVDSDGNDYEYSWNHE